MGIRLLNYLKRGPDLNEGEKVNNLYSDEPTKYERSGINRRKFIKTTVGGLTALSLGKAIIDFIGDSFQDEAYAARTKDIAIFDFNVNCSDCTPEQNEKGAEVSNKLAFYLGRNMSDVHVYRLRGYYDFSELPRRLNVDTCIKGSLLFDSGKVKLFAKCLDLYPHNTGDKSYGLTVLESRLDRVLRNLATAITKDLGGKVKAIRENIESKEYQQSETKDAKRKRLRKLIVENFERKKGDMTDEEFRKWLIEKHGNIRGENTFNRYKNYKSELEKQ